MAGVTFVLFFVWAAAMLVSCWSVEAARMFSRRIWKDAHRAKAGLPKFQPPVAVILPIKGVDEDTAENVQALLAQDYPNSRLLFAVESADDPAVELLKKLSQNQPAGKVEIVVAGLATERGQKIQNQLAAVDRTTSADEVIVFMDADAHPKANWLRTLVGPLENVVVGATTGYRLYVPEGKSSVASAMVSVINATVAALLGPPQRNFAWGGSMAIRRVDFFDYGVNTAWQHALSDDYVLSYCVKRRIKRHIQFVPNCFVGSSATLNWSSFFEFASRQYLITKICAPWVWATAVLGELMFVVALAYPPIVWTIRLVQHRPDHLLLLMFLALYIANVIRGFFLLSGAKRALPSDAPKLKKIGFWYTFGYPVAMLANLLALLRSAFGSTIIWRGVKYKMCSRTQTEVDRKISIPPTALHPIKG